MHSLHNLTLLVGRLLIAALFVFDAFVMLQSWDATAQYMQSFGLPSSLLPLAALFQFAAGLMVAFGVWTRLAALGLAGYCLVTAVVFHRNLGATSEIVQAGKDFAIAGGFLILASVGPGAWSIDRAGRR